MPPGPIQPRAVSRAAAASHCSSVQPRMGCRSSRRMSRPQRSSSTSQPSMSAVAMAAKCPSPRCSRSTVAACQSRPTGSSGSGSAALAAARARPAQSSSARRPAEQVRGRRHLGVEPAEQAAQRAGRPGTAGSQGFGRRDQIPDPGDRPGDHGGGEVEERGPDHGRIHRAQRGGPAREIPSPEPAQARLLELRARLRGKVDHRVDRLEQRPHRTGNVKIGHNHATVSRTPAAAGRGRAGLRASHFPPRRRAGAAPPAGSRLSPSHPGPLTAHRQAPRRVRRPRPALRGSRPRAHRDPPRRSPS